MHAIKYVIKPFILLRETRCVFCDVRILFLYVMQFNVCLKSVKNVDFF
jgi:hypothetical protein